MAQTKEHGYLIPDVLTPNEFLCFTISIPKNDAHIRAFLGQIEHLGYWWAWDKDEDKNGAILARYWRGLANVAIAQFWANYDNTCEVQMFDIRQNPQNPCQLEKTTNGGQTWSLGFDYSLCMSSGGGGGDGNVTNITNVTNVYRTEQTIANETRNTYVSNPPVVPSSAIDACGVVSAFVRHLARQKLLQLQIAGGLSPIVAGFVLGNPLIAPFGWFVVNNLLPVVSNAGLVDLVATLALLQNESELDALACVMHDNIKTQNPLTQAGFSSSMSGGNALLVSALAPELPANFNLFVDMVNRGGSLSLPCTCEDVILVNRGNGNIDRYPDGATITVAQGEEITRSAGRQIQVAFVSFTGDVGCVNLGLSNACLSFAEASGVPTIAVRTCCGGGGDSTFVVTKVG